MMDDLYEIFSFTQHVSVEDVEIEIDVTIDAQVDGGVDASAGESVTLTLNGRPSDLVEALVKVTGQEIADLTQGDLFRLLSAVLACHGTDSMRWLAKQHLSLGVEIPMREGEIGEEDVTAWLAEDPFRRVARVGEIFAELVSRTKG